MAERLPLSVWPTAQRASRAQRSERYLPSSGPHPAKMLPAIAHQQDPGIYPFGSIKQLHHIAGAKLARLIDEDHLAGRRVDPERRVAVPRDLGLGVAVGKPGVGKP